jgi:hypothetical protein
MKETGRALLKGLLTLNSHMCSLYRKGVTTGQTKGLKIGGFSPIRNLFPMILPQLCSAKSKRGTFLHTFSAMTSVYSGQVCIIDELWFFLRTVGSSERESIGRSPHFLQAQFPRFTGCCKYEGCRDSRSDLHVSGAKEFRQVQVY